LRHQPQDLDLAAGESREPTVLDSLIVRVDVETQLAAMSQLNDPIAKWLRAEVGRDAEGLGERLGRGVPITGGEMRGG